MISNEHHTETIVQNSQFYTSQFIAQCHDITKYGTETHTHTQTHTHTNRALLVQRLPMPSHYSVLDAMNKNWTSQRQRSTHNKFLIFRSQFIFLRVQILVIQIVVLLDWHHAVLAVPRSCLDDSRKLSALQ